MRNEGTRRGGIRDKTMENVEDRNKLEKCIQIHFKHVTWPYKAFPQICSFQPLFLFHGAL